MSLREDLADWTDWDGAAHALAQSIGLMDRSLSINTDAKHLYWSDNPIGKALQAALESFTAAGFLERREEPDIQFRWRAAFRGSWGDRSRTSP
jgi:hypothetical protein